MFCSNCGNQVAEGAAFCANCGNAVNAQAAPVETPAAEPVAVATPVAEPVQEQTFAPAPEAQNVYGNAPTYQSAPTFNAAPVAAGPSASSVMIKGILAIAFACSFYLSFLGIVFGSMAKNAVAQFQAANGGQLFGQAKVGSILGKVGFILGIVMTVLFVIWLFAFMMTIAV